jgi:hypothetical protein
MKKLFTLGLAMGLFFQILGVVALTGELSNGSPSLVGAFMIVLWLTIIVMGSVLAAARRTPVC